MLQAFCKLSLIVKFKIWNLIYHQQNIKKINDVRNFILSFWEKPLFHEKYTFCLDYSSDIKPFVVFVKGLFLLMYQFKNDHFCSTYYMNDMLSYSNLKDHKSQTDLLLAVSLLYFENSAGFCRKITSYLTSSWYTRQNDK